MNMYRFKSTIYLLFLCSLIPLIIAECTRETLQAAADSYLASQSSGKLQEVFANGVIYQENNKTVDIQSGVLKQPLKIDHNKTIVDTTLCATYTELVVTDSANPYVIGTQIRHQTSSDGSTKVALIDTIATTTGDWLFNATKTLSYIVQESWSPIAAEKRDARSTIQAAADAYLDLWGNSSAAVPWGTPCARLEGSAYTGKGEPTDSCAVGIPGGNQPPNTHRRYVIDETLGSVSVLCVFETMRNAPDSHEFRLEGGKLRYVHTMTVMRGR